MKKTAKLIAAAALALALLAGCGGSAGGNGTAAAPDAPAQQAGQEQPGIIGDHFVRAQDGVVELPTSGLKFTLPEDVVAAGYNVAGWSRVSYDGLWSHLYLYDSDEDLASQLSQPSFYEIIGISPDQDIADYLATELSDEARELGGTPENLLGCYVDLGQNESYHYYAMDHEKIAEVLPTMGDLEAMASYYKDDLNLSPELVDQAMTLIPRFSDFVAGTEITELTLPKVQKADDISVSELANMTLQDLEGNPVKLGDLFAQNKLTMVDMWRTTCVVCVEDMPMLERLSQEYADQGFGIVSVCCDVIDSDGTADADELSRAQEIVASAGTTYPTVLADQTYRDLIEVVATPTTIYVDSQGNIVDGPARGSYPEDMMKGVIEGNLAKVQ